MLLEKLLEMNGVDCACGKKHAFHSRIVSGSGAALQLPELVKGLGGKNAYILADPNTYAVAGESVCEILLRAGVAYSLYCFERERPEPDERNVGSAFMHLKSECDIIIGVGSGVINDISKILAMHTGLPFIIVATAPSMDGYASMSSSVTLDGIKVSLPSRCADIIVGDTDIIKKAPKKMLLSGIGDMLAKYVSICEWRIASLIVGEYYCENIAALVREALKTTVESAKEALDGDENAVMEVFDALIVGSVAMNYAGLSRPASGVEHYISHLFDTRGVEFGEKTELHGIQCAVATLCAAGLYEKLLEIKPDPEKAKSFVSEFDLCHWNESLRTLLGKSAEPLILLEKSEGKYDKNQHSERLGVILNAWESIVQIVKEEIPAAAELKAWMKSIGMPCGFGEIGMKEELMPEIFRATKDIRNKYVLSRLLWDLGLLDEFSEKII